MFMCDILGAGKYILKLLVRLYFIHVKPCKVNQFFLFTFSVKEKAMHIFPLYEKFQ